MDVEYEEKVIRKLQFKRDEEEPGNEEWISMNDLIVSLQDELDKVKSNEANRSLSIERIETDKALELAHQKSDTRNKILGIVGGILGSAGIVFLSAWANRDQVQDKFSQTQAGKLLDNSIYRDGSH